MKNLLYLSILSLFIIGCGGKPAAVPSSAPIVASKEKPEKSIIEKEKPSGAKTLTFQKSGGYFLKSSVKLPNPVNFFVLTSSRTMFTAISETSSQKPPQNLNYDKNIVIAIALPASNSKYDIQMLSANYKDNIIEINYNIKPIENSTVFYYAASSGFFVLEKQNPITNVRFYTDGKLIADILFGKRNSNSPKNLKDLKNSYMGSYKGQLPSGEIDESMITTLILSSDSNYILRRSYLNDKNRSFESKGKWLPTDDLSSIVLDYDKAKSDHIYLYFLDKSTIEWFDASGERKDTKTYRLKK
ncbi:MAG: copper resistance protein NlpE [Elusimicrobiota bacterium]|jgi:hypothetical protein|nr:copper resistance protein NlpE [Elusimicrobiota bacterium]